MAESDLAGLRSWCREAPKEIQKEFRRVSKEIGDAAAAEARSRVYPAVKGRSSRGRVVEGRRRSRGEGLSATKASIKAKGDRAGVSLSIGGTGAPAALGHEFGGGKKPTTRQFPVHKGREGYFFYPTIRRHTDELVEMFGDAVEEIWPRQL
jgi:hypothetical protein